MNALLKSKLIMPILLVVIFTVELSYYLHSNFKLEAFIDSPLPPSYQERLFPVFQKPDLADSSYLLNPIFNSTRKPISHNQVTEYSTAVSSNIDKWSLVGIVTGKSINKAILYNQETAKHKVVAIDDIIENWFVVNIMPTRLNLQRDGVSKTLSIDLSKKTSIEHDIFNTTNLIKDDE